MAGAEKSLRFSIRKGTAALLVVLTLWASLTIGFTLISSSSSSVPTQIYRPTASSSDQRVVCIIFDGGWKTHLDAAAVLEDYNFSATFPIVTSYVGYPAYMTWDDLASLAQRGNDIVSQTSRRINLSAVDDTTLQAELAGSREILRSKGYPADVLVYPSSEAANNSTVRNTAAQSYLLAAGTQTGKCELDSLDRYNLDSYVINRNTALADFTAYLKGTEGNTITILYYHKVSGENHDNVVPKDAFEMQMQYLKDNNYTVRTISQQFLKQIR